MNLFKSIIFACVLLTSTSAFCDTAFLEAKSFPQERLVETMAQEQHLDMCWCFGEGSHFRFLAKSSSIYLETRLNHLPAEFDAMIERLQGTLVLEEAGVWTYSYKIEDKGLEEINIHPVRPYQSPDSTSYIVGERRIFEEAKPTLISEADLSDILKNKKVLFYTGAGLSIASGVPSMEELQSLMGFGETEDIVYAVEHVLKDPEAAVHVIKAFQTSCHHGKPTPAHRAIKELSHFQNTRVITENLDFLHEVSGMEPYRLMDADEVREKLGSEELNQFDYVVCVGLSFDDRGFLGRYKEHNPQGKIIAVDLHQPSYLGDDDYLLQGDLQEVMPALSARI